MSYKSIICRSVLLAGLLLAMRPAAAPAGTPPAAPAPASQAPASQPTLASQSPPPLPAATPAPTPVATPAETGQVAPGATPQPTPAVISGVVLPAGTQVLLAKPGLQTVPQPLTEEAAVRIGLQRNPQIIAGQAGVESAEATYRSTAAFPPLNLALTHATGTSTAPTLNGEGTDTYFDLGDTLDTSGQRRLQAASLRAQFGASNYTYFETRLTLTQQIRDAYWSLAAALAQTDFSRKNQDDVQRVYDATREQFKAGASPQVDVLRSSIDLANAKQAFLTARSADQAALSALNVLLGRAPDASLELADAFTESTSIVQLLPALPSISELTRTAMANRPAAKAAVATVRAAEYSVKQSRAQRLPDLSVDYERSVHDSSSASLIVAAHMPIFDFGSIGQSVKAAEQTKRQAEAQADQSDQQIDQQVTQAYQDYTLAQQLAASYLTDILTPSVTLLDKAQIGYKQGGTGILPVIDAETTLRNARTGYIGALLSLYKARDEVEAATGVTLEK